MPSPEETLAALQNRDTTWWHRLRTMYPDWTPKLPPAPTTDLRRRDLSDMDLRGLNLRGADLSGANLSRSRLEKADLSGANLVRAQLAGATFNGAVLIGTKGLFGTNHARFGTYEDEAAAGVETTFFRKPGDHLSWSILRSITTLRVFGASYILIVVLVAYAGLVEFINDTSYRWATLVPVRGEYTQSLRDFLVSKTPLIEVDPHFGIQILMVLFLALGATIYEFFCPDVVKENSEIRWTRELNQSLIEYRAADASHAWARTAAFFFYGTGALYTLAYGSLKVIHAIMYFFGLLGSVYL